MPPVGQSGCEARLPVLLVPSVFVSSPYPQTHVRSGHPSPAKSVLNISSSSKLQVPCLTDKALVTTPASIYSAPWTTSPVLCSPVPPFAMQFAILEASVPAFPVSKEDALPQVSIWPTASTLPVSAQHTLLEMPSPAVLSISPLLCPPITVILPVLIDCGSWHLVKTPLFSCHMCALKF